MLTIAAGLSFLIAAFQVVLIFNADLARAYGAPQAFLDEPILMLITGLAMTALFIIFDGCALSGAGYIRPLPILRFALLLIGLIFIFRSLRVVVEPLVESAVAPYPPQEIPAAAVYVVSLPPERVLNSGVDDR